MFFGLKHINARNNSENIGKSTPILQEIPKIKFTFFLHKK